jgi:hypothetical protein
LPDRRAAAVAAAIVAVFLVPIALALTERESVAFHFGTAQPGMRAVVPAEKRLCQRHIDVPVAFATVRSPGGGEVSVHGDSSSGGTVDVCVRNPGPGPLALPAAGGGATSSQADIGGRAIPVDVELEFRRERPVSMAGRLGEMRARLALFKPAWLGEGSITALAIAILLGVPLLLLLAVTRDR